VFCTSYSKEFTTLRSYENNLNKCSLTIARAAADPRLQPTGVTILDKKYMLEHLYKPYGVIGHSISSQVVA
jgi:hypothetical protein